MKNRKNKFIDTILFTIFFVAISGFAAFMAILVYFLRLLGVN